MLKSFRPGLADHAADEQQAQQFYLIGAAKPEQAGIAGVAGGLAAVAADPSSLVLPAQSVSPAGEAKSEPAGVTGSFVLDAPDPASPALPAAGATFPADEPPTVADTQILVALKDGSLFLFDKDLLSGHPLELRDALGEAGIVFGDPAQGSDVLEEFGLTSLLGGWLSELQGLAPGDAGDLAPHNGFF